MAATKRNAMLIEEAREKIKTTQLINRLQNHALGKLTKPLDQSQVRAVEILLKKRIPDLSAVNLQADVNVAIGNSLMDIINNGNRAPTKD